MIERSFCGEVGTGVRQFVAARVLAVAPSASDIVVLVQLPEMARQWEYFIPGCKTFTPHHFVRAELSGAAVVLVDELHEPTFRKICRVLHDSNTPVWLINRDLP